MEFAKDIVTGCFDYIDEISKKHFIDGLLIPVSKFYGHIIYRVAQEEQLKPTNNDGFTTMIHNGEPQGDLSPIWYTTEEGVDFYVKDEARQPNGYLIEAKITSNLENAYFINFSKNGKLDFKTINRFIDLMGARQLLNCNPFDESNETRNSHLYEDVTLFRHLIKKLDECGCLMDCDIGHQPCNAICGFYLGLSDSGMTYGTEDSFQYYPEYIIIQKFQKDILSIVNDKSSEKKRPASNSSNKDTSQKRPTKRRGGKSTRKKRKTMKKRSTKRKNKMKKRK